VNAELAGVGNLVLQQARIPIRGTLRDDFAVTGAELAYRWRTTPDAEPTETMRKPVAGWDAQGSASGERSSFEAELDLQNVEIPLESSLQLMVEATDNDDVSGPKVGRSAAMFVKIVDEDQFRQDLTRREQEQRRELERLMKQQRDLQTETRILLAAFDEPDADPDALRRGLLASQRTQRQIGEGSAGVARQFEQMVAEVLNNRLEDSTGGTVQRYQNQVIDELAIVAEAQSPAVVDLQERARRSWSEPADRDAALRSAAEAQLEIAAALERVLSNLAKAEGIAELVNLLREVMREQEQVKTATADKREEAIDDVFED